MAHPGKTLREILAELDDLRARADASFARVAAEHPQALNCRLGCDDCCHALFDLSPVESLALALAFAELPRASRREVQRRGEKAAAAFDKAMAAAFSLQGEARLAALSAARVPCPLLENGRCQLYASRPLTCRLYGIPINIEGQARICHRSHFEPGRTYPTVDMLRVQMELERLSGLTAHYLPTLANARRDMARSLDLAQSHGPLLRSLLDKPPA
ncbi:MAG: YkgJ family cysteine cluster protein [Pseudomonadota bacterium]